ncbi:MAG: TolB family protein, partial [Gammaproteobacteria bacterium]
MVNCRRSLLRRVGTLCLPALAAMAIAPGSAAERAAFTAADVVLEREVYSPVLSPDGAWAAYITRVNELDRDARNADLWMASIDGLRNIRLTRSTVSESRPGWSPDSRYLSFLAPGGTRDPAGKETPGPRQIWLLDRAGGEPEQLTAFGGDVVDYAWSPDGRQLAVVAWDPDSRKPARADATPAPIVIDRYYFKEDYTGYLGPERKRLHVFDMATRKAERLSDSPWDET